MNDPSLQQSLKLYNPRNNPPVCADHAVQQVPLSRLPTRDTETLIRSFCAGVWAGSGYSGQRKILEKREGMLWDKEELEESEYGVGSIITDHFEVVERGGDKTACFLPSPILVRLLTGWVVIRCGDSPLVRGDRPSDGLFVLEVTRDEKFANFHMKSVFFDSTARGDRAGKLPVWMDFAHRIYVRLLMRSGVEAVEGRG
ncbi:hypothetical protein L873DRAFT_1825150 [Choiromyces venosus 120613-1]|uniref:DUF1990 domain-containing protein n=1 Tax=Choiromyces venosus 120613-1 TaxID=1336337 RepID=A0A3N4K490_9PEZI|nr:hypothetical protein L873DRAFT_1825150 [Choiromyces venosus 120613-1]